MITTLQKLAGYTTAILITLAMFGIGMWLTHDEPIGAATLKVSKSDIVYSHEYTEYERDEDGKVLSQKQIVNYAYKSGEEAPVLKDEIIEERTQNIVTRNLGGNKRSAQSGYNFYQDNDGWKKVKFATTTPEVFNKVSLWDRFIAWAADTGETSPGTMADDATIGTITWSGPDSAKVSDNVDASVDLQLEDVAHYLKATNFGFSIPSATIDGILAEIEQMEETLEIKENAIKIVKSDASIGTTNKSTTAELPESDTYISYGSSSDLWGETWLNTDINDSDFGVVYSAKCGNNYSGHSYVDHIRITVYYTAGVSDTCTIDITGKHAMDMQDHCTTTVSVYSDYGMECYNTVGGSWVIGAGIEVRVASSTNCIPQIESTGVFSIQPIH